MSPRAVPLHTYPGVRHAKSVDFRPIFAQPGSVVMFDTSGLVPFTLGNRILQAFGEPEANRTIELVAGPWGIGSSELNRIETRGRAVGFEDVKALRQLIDYVRMRVKEAIAFESKQPVDFRYAELRIESAPEKLFLDRGHVDGGVITVIVTLLGAGTRFQIGPGVPSSQKRQRFDPSLPVEEVPPSNGFAFAGTDLEGGVALVHGRPTTSDPRVLLVMRWYPTGQVKR